MCQNFFGFGDGPGNNSNRALILHTPGKAPMPSRRLTILSLALCTWMLGGPGEGQQAPAAADPNLLQKGEYLAHAADCVACHSAPGGAAYAGGRGMGTPMGVLYATNITPDPETGIGRYSLQEFDQALRRGIARDGHHLYPAMPYPSYAKISAEDVAALYAYFTRGVQPVRQANKPAEIPWYLNVRWAMPLWNMVFLEDGPFRPDPGKDAQWNRGAYLVQGAGHCGACHTPRGWLFQEKALTHASSLYLSGASLDNWSAVDLTGDATAGLGRWSQDQLVTFLKTGRNDVATAFGSMIDVINYSTQFLTDEDNAAMAAYLKSLAPAHPGSQPSWTYDAATATALAGLRFDTPGALTYLHYCAGCHQQDGSGQQPFVPALAGNPAVLDSDAVSLINITLNGSPPLVIKGYPDAYRMPTFRAVLDDRQVAEVIGFVRGAWGNQAGKVTAADVGRLRGKSDATQVDQLNLLRMR